MGRPTKLTEKVVAEAEKYYQECLREDKMPVIGRLAIRLGVHRDTVHAWSTSAGDYGGSSYTKDFSDCLKRIENLMETKLQENMVEGGKSMIGSMFLLKSKFGYIETSKQIQEGNNTNVVVIDSSKAGYVPPSSSFEPKQDSKTH